MMGASQGQVPAHLEFAFETKVFFRADRCVFGPVPGGHHQGYTPCIGGEITGPALTGEIVPDSGADYADVRPDGTVVINSHYLLRAEDGTNIYINNRGYLVPSAEGGGEVIGGVRQPAYFRFTPTFIVPEGPLGWLARTVFVGAGRRCTDPDHSIFSYYAVR
ncbi:hypothetical protein GCM10023208_14170 [Erythrobacter westpacificensis]|uniref:Uncharacterized protein n=1 Tax=Erythrobacter westpacificensis TaxID=1055231 RepID=A0ABP9KA60_9SPHN